MSQDIKSVSALREALWAQGFRPVPVINAILGDKLSGKRPIPGNGWQIEAQKNPPFCAVNPAVAHALNTGIDCTGLLVADFDLDDPLMSTACQALAVKHMGWAPVRRRSGSSRCLMPYAVAGEGQPRSLPALTGASHTETHGCKIEVLGKGRQFVAYGSHYSGDDLEWSEDLSRIHISELSVVTEAQVHAFLVACAAIIDAPPPGAARTAKPNGAGGNGQDRGSSELHAEAWRIASAMAVVPNDAPPNWEQWNTVGMAIWSATQGAEEGWEIFRDWSARNPAYDEGKTRARWDHYPSSPPTRIGAGTLFHMANLAGWGVDHLGLFSRRQTGDGQAGQTGQTSQDDDEEFLSGLPIVYYEDIQPNLNAADFVEDLLIEGAMSVIYGESNSGKTFFASDLALHVASGTPWCGKSIEPGGVIYCCLEGAHGASNRIAAWRLYHGIPTANLAIIPASINLLDPKADTPRLLDAIRTVQARLGVPVRWVIIDTLSRAMAGGNENAPDDMGALVTNADRIRQVTNAHLSFVHHSGKDSAKGARGHSLLRAATDTEIEITDQDGEKSARVTKQRELDCSGEFNFTLKVVELGANRRGKAVSSCVVIYGDEPATTTKRRPKLQGHTKRAFDILTNAIAGHGATGYANVPPGFMSIPEEWWRDRFYEEALPGAPQTTKQRTFRRSADSLVELQIVGMAGGRVWLPHQENAP